MFGGGGGDPSVLFDALFSGNRLDRILALIVIVVILNFFLFVAIGMSIGGDALNGRVVSGHYYLGPGKLKEVSPALFAYSRWHAISLFVTFPPAMLLLFVLKRRRDVPRRLPMESFEIIATGDPNSGFDQWVEMLKRAGIEAKQVAMAEYDREHGYTPIPHPRGNEVYVLVPAERLEEALKILKASGVSSPG